MSCTIRCRTSSRVSLWAGAAVGAGDPGGWWGAVWEAQEWDGGGSLAPDVEVPPQGHVAQGPTPPDGQHQSHHVRAEAWAVGAVAVTHGGDATGTRVEWELGGQWEDGFPAASPLSDRSRELTAPASHTKSWITWAPAERS